MSESKKTVTASGDRKDDRRVASRRRALLAGAALAALSTAGLDGSTQIAQVQQATLPAANGKKL
jgi:hypothetical protein